MTAPVTNSQSLDAAQQGESLSVARQDQEVKGMIESVASAFDGDLAPGDLKLYRELDDLARYIQTAKEEIAALCPDDISGRHIAAATDQLDAIVAHTEEATGFILDAAECIEEAAKALEPEVGQKITEAVTRIYEACNFQDITGQRISKVVGTLKHIDEKIGVLVSAFGGVSEDAAAVGANKDSGKADDGDAPAHPTQAGKVLLEGPQLPSAATSQDEIDALFESFD